MPVGVSAGRPGRLVVISGGMYSGKTDELVRLMRRAEIAGRTCLLVRPALDTRVAPEVATSRSGRAFPSVVVPDAAAIATVARSSGARVVGVDEAQFFDAALPEVLDALADEDRLVVAAGLNTDFRGRPFGPMPELLARADELISVSAICTVCGESASRSQRLVAGTPATADAPLVAIGGYTPGSETYEARCRRHHER